jgi:tRNA pseudouridine38-40 synthase
LQRYFIQLSFCGTNYHGWQVQPNGQSVQEVMEKSLSVLLREDIKVTGAGRTDTGVHARFYVAHFDAENTNPGKPDFTSRLNSFLPNDIAVQKIWKVAGNANARFDATSRTYSYCISRVKNPFATNTAYYYHQPLDVEKMNEAAKILFDYSDFASFCKLHSGNKTNTCKIYQAEWNEGAGQLVFTIKADRFLRNMVRAIVGTLLEVGKGKITVSKFRDIIEKKDRCAAGTSVPAKGLFLENIEYPGFT